LEDQTATSAELELATCDHPIDLRKIEAVLAEHPGVREAVATLWEPRLGDRRPVAYVVPNDQYIDRILGAPEEERRRLLKWRLVFDWYVGGKTANSSQPALHAWGSSYTGQDYPLEHMREYVEMTVAEILSLRPAEVLEVGCGTGALLLRIAPQCNRYVGIDFSPESLKSLRNQMETLGGDRFQVTLGPVHTNVTILG
jgi:SAM-dependent methyltransferase